MKDKIVKKFLSSILEETGIHIKSIFLFGSRAKNTHSPYSDYDILMVLDKKTPEIIDKIYDKVMEFLLNYGVDISLKIYTEEDYNQKFSLGTSFMKEIKKHGELLWSQK